VVWLTPDDFDDNILVVSQSPLEFSSN
jgi:hypothetical protein